jgi:hypothetical protein
MQNTIYHSVSVIEMRVILAPQCYLAWADPYYDIYFFEKLQLGRNCFYRRIAKSKMSSERKL